MSLISCVFCVYLWIVPQKFIDIVREKKSVIMKLSYSKKNNNAMFIYSWNILSDWTIQIEAASHHWKLNKP